MTKKSTESRSARGAQAREMRAASRKQRRSQTSHTQRQKDKNGEERRHMNKETPSVPVRNTEYWQVQQECKTPLQTSAPKPAPRKKKRLVGWGASVSYTHLDVYKRQHI